MLENPCHFLLVHSINHTHWNLTSYWILTSVSLQVSKPIKIFVLSSFDMFCVQLHRSLVSSSGLWSQPSSLRLSLHCYSATLTALEHLTQVAVILAASQTLLPVLCRCSPQN